MGDEYFIINKNEVDYNDDKLLSPLYALHHIRH